MMLHRLPSLCRSRAVLALALTLLLAGCGWIGKTPPRQQQTSVAAPASGVGAKPGTTGDVTPQTQPAPASGSPARTAVDPVTLLVASVKLTQVDIATGEYLQPGGLARVGTGPLTMAFSFKGAMSGLSLESRLQISAPQPPRPYWRGTDLLVLEFPDGQDGDQVEVRLPRGLPLPGGGELPQDLVYTFQRVVGAGVLFTLNGEVLQWPQQSRSWLPVTGRVELGLKFSAAVNRDSVAQVIRQNARSGNDKDMEVAFIWADDTSARLVMVRRPGEESVINLSGAVDKAGNPLAMTGPPLRLRWEEESSFWAIAADGRDTTAVAKLPHRVSGALASPAGHRVAYLEDDHQSLPRLWLWHLGSGQRWDTGLRVPGIHHLAWVDGTRLLALVGNKLWQVDGEDRAATLIATSTIVAVGGSGDGTAAWVVASTAGNSVRYDLYLRAGESAEQVVKGVVQRSGAGAGTMIMPVALSRDGRWAALPLSAAPVPSVTLIDLKQARTDPPNHSFWARELPVDASVSAGPLTFSPDGTWLIAGEQLLRISNGQTLTRLQGVRSAHWSGDGQRVLYTAAAGPTPGGPRVLSLSGGGTVALQGSEGMGWTAGGYALVRRP